MDESLLVQLFQKLKSVPGLLDTLMGRYQGTDKSLDRLQTFDKNKDIPIPRLPLRWEDQTKDVGLTMDQARAQWDWGKPIPGNVSLEEIITPQKPSAPTPLPHGRDRHEWSNELFYGEPRKRLM